MKTTTAKPPPTYGDHLPITPFQIKRIMSNCNYNVDIKDEWVQWVTEDVNRTSLKSITQAQAVKIIRQQTGSPPLEGLGEVNYATFDKTNPKHKVILSICHQLQWTKPSVKWGEVPDLDKLSNFLQSDRSPVKKKLKDMTDLEIQKIIKALNGIIKHTYK